MIAINHSFELVGNQFSYHKSTLKSPLFTLGYIIQWIGLKKLQENPIFNGKNLWFPVDFP
jgi:hypothetical protein